MVRKLILFLEMHQPRRLKYGVLNKLCDLRSDEINEVGISSIIFNDEVNKEILNRVADRSYVPTRVNEGFG
ncbi:hypothetical protein [Vulcanisaeta distributa]|uniref:hypothetical protein n=1 Tax=Vulcanisaeta distributa TaxID=164451 RepID=UPI001FB3D74E|nr:hypothetical protein [Vulcanisaeta distributa]